MTNTTCQYCIETHAFPMAVENFEDDRGFSIYDLSLYGTVPAEPLTWEAITPETQFEAAYNYMMGVARDYMTGGDAHCYCV